MGNPQGLLADEGLVQSVHWLDALTWDSGTKNGDYGVVPTVQGYTSQQLLPECGRGHRSKAQWIQVTPKWGFGRLIQHAGLSLRS